MELTEQHNPQNVKPCRPAGGFALVRSVLDDKDHRTAAVLLVSYLIEDAGGKSKGTRLSDRRGKIFYEDRYTIIAVQVHLPFLPHCNRFLHTRLTP